MSNPKAPYRYPGVQPFTTTQSEVFFGREQDTIDLYRIISSEPLVVLYGKSGLGKSSLLNAGIVPYSLQKGLYQPIVVKFGTWTEEKIETPLEVTKACLSAGFEKHALLINLLPNDDSLWRCVKDRQLNGGARPLLLFDQFEELFTYPESELHAFREELAELLHTELPLRYRRLLDSNNTLLLSENEEELLETPLEASIVFTVRADRLHLLHQLADYLPNILRNLYALRALRPADAESAIVSPALKEGYFCTVPFVWSASAIRTLMAYLKDPQDEDRVEGILLQLLCQYYEEKLIEKQGLSLIDDNHLGNLEMIVENYYYDKLVDLGDAQIQIAVRRLIEEGLVMEGENIRLSLHEAQITKQYGLETTLLEPLVNSRLLRAEPFMRGGYLYELAHDRLVAPVLRAKQERLILEAQEASERERIEKEKELAREQKKRKVTSAIAIVGFILAAVALGTTFIAFNKAKQARIAKNNAEISKKAALDSAIVAQNQRKLANEANLNSQNAANRAEQEKEKALAALEKARQEQFKKLMADADVFRYEKHFEDALETYTTALELAQTPEEKKQLNQVRSKTLFEKNEFDFIRYRNIGLAMIAAKDCQGALSYLEKAKSLHPNDPIITKAIAECNQ